MFNGLFYVTLALAVCDWVSVWRKWRTGLLIFKPATLLALIAWSLQISGWQGGMIWFGLALAFSLLGDIALLFSERYFIYGLGAFFVGHVFYLMGFNSTPLPNTPWALLPAAAVLLLSFAVMKTICSGVSQSPKHRPLLPAVIVYAVVLSLMFLSAATTFYKPGWNFQASAWAAAGGLLFLTSDSILAYNRFVKTQPQGQLKTHITYHLGQVGLIAGALTWFLSQH